MLKHFSILITLHLLLATTIAQTHVATVTKFTNSSVSIISKSFASASTTGNLIVVHLSWDNQSRAVSSVTDNKGNTYFRINGPTNWHTNYRSELWYAYNITGGGAAINITANLTGVSTSYFQIYMSEYSGIRTFSPLDQKSVNTGSTAAVTSGSKTTVFGTELIYGVSIGASGNLTFGGTFTARSTANANIVEDKITAATGSYSATFTSAGGNWVAEMATFRSNSILPVELISFDAKLTSERAVKLDWSTATEINNDYFEVERSIDGIAWTVVKKIKGAGNSDRKIYYSVTDNIPYAGVSYYRLKQTDFDRQNKLSEIRVIHNDHRSTTKLNIYPNPVHNNLSIEGNYADVHNFIVTNYLGQLVNSKIRMISKNDFRIDVDVSSLTCGVYVLKTKNKSAAFFKQ
jgi:hypothetical protein